MARIDPNNRQPGQIAYLGMDNHWYDNPNEGAQLWNFEPGWAPPAVVDAQGWTEEQKLWYYSLRRPLVNTGRWNVLPGDPYWVPPTVNTSAGTQPVVGASTFGADLTQPAAVPGAVDRADGSTVLASGVVVPPGISVFSATFLGPEAVAVVEAREMAAQAGKKNAQ